MRRAEDGLHGMLTKQARRESTFLYATLGSRDHLASGLGTFLPASLFCRRFLLLELEEVQHSACKAEPAKSMQLIAPSPSAPGTREGQRQIEETASALACTGGEGALALAAILRLPHSVW